MQLIECAQGSPEWFRARLGVPTASMITSIVTPAKLELSKQSRDYAFRLMAERITGQPHPERFETEAMRNGRAVEAVAAANYDLLFDVTTFPVGFILSDCGRWGASPDRLTNDMRGGVEIKCPMQHTHVAYAVDGLADEYVLQRHMQMLVADLEYVDLFSFHPEMPAVHHRLLRDEAIMSKLRSALEQFSEQMTRTEAKLVDRWFGSAE